MGKTAEISHVLTLEEIGKLTAKGGKPTETLKNVVALIAKRFQSDVCSVYLLEPDRANLVLAATVGLRPQSVGTLRMGVHEGLAGLVAEQVRPVNVGSGAKPPAVQVLQRFRRRRLSIVSGSAADRPGRVARRSSGANRRVPHFPGRRSRNADRGGLGSGAHRERGAHSRPLHRSRTGTPVGVGPQSVVELGSRRQQLVPLPRSRSLETAQSQSRRPACGDPLSHAGAPCQGIGVARPNQLCLPPSARVSRRRPHLGCAACWSPAASPGRLLLSRVRTACFGSRVLGRIGCSRGRPHQERFRPGHPA